MKSPVKPPDRFSRSHRPGIAGRRPIAAPAAGGARPTLPAQVNRPASPNVRPPVTPTGQANRNAIQSRGAVPQAGANRPGSAVNQRVPARPPSAVTSRAANYTVHAPIHMGGRGQQIRATIQGTPQVAGSVEISSAGPGKVYISNLTVDQQHRRRGVAAKLIDAAITTARRQGFSAASLEARPSDNGITPQTLVAMYRRKGFKSVGKSGRGSPLMERKL